MEACAVRAQQPGNIVPGLDCEDREVQTLLISRLAGDARTYLGDDGGIEKLLGVAQPYNLAGFDTEFVER